jgi:hypothetical protein
VRVGANVTGCKSRCCSKTVGSTVVCFTQSQELSSFVKLCWGGAGFHCRSGHRSPIWTVVIVVLPSSSRKLPRWPPFEAVQNYHSPSSCHRRCIMLDMTTTVVTLATNRAVVLHSRQGLVHLFAFLELRVRTSHSFRV